MELNTYVYGTYTSHCGCCEGESERWVLITPLVESEVCERMRKYADEHKGSYHHGNFLNSLQGEGMFFTDCSSSEFPEFWGEMAGSYIDMTQIKEHDIYSEDTYKEIVQKRQEDRRLREEEAQKKAAEAMRQREYAQYLKLKNQFERK